MFREMNLACANPEETKKILVRWLRLDPEIAARSYELGQRGWCDGTVSDAAVKLLVDQSLLELNSKELVPLDRVRDWSFARQARRELGTSSARR